MATGTVKRHDVLPLPRYFCKNNDGSVYDLTNHTVKFIMMIQDSLQEAITSTDTTLKLGTDMADVIESADVILIDHERVTVTGVPTLPLTTETTADYTITRASSIAGTGGYVNGSTDVNGLGVNKYVVSTDSTFFIDVDGAGATQVDVLATRTTSNLSMANLVADVQVDIDAATAGITVTNIFDKLVLTSDTLGVGGTVSITSPDAATIAQLGIVVGNGIGTATETTTAIAHNTDVTANVLKLETNAEVDSLTLGTIKYQWQSADTNKLGTFLMEFELKNSNGKKETFPKTSPSDYTVEIVADSNDKLIS